MKNLLNKFRKNNKGFTLVELIIVIAIIAVLSAVIAPQYIKYVENSRVGVDESYISEVAHNMELTAASSEKVNGKQVTVKFSDAGVMTIAKVAAGDADAETVITATLVGTAADPGLFPTAKQTFKSKFYTTGAGKDKVVLTLKTDGSVKIEGTQNLNRA